MNNSKSINKIFAIFLSITLAFSLSLTPAVAFGDTLKSDVITTGTVEARGLKLTDCPSLSSPSVVMKDDEGKLLFSRDADKEMKIASLTKLMTAILALENLNESDTITVSSRAATVGGSSANLQAGDTLSFSDAMLGLMVPSGNDAAVAIAEAVGKKLANTTDESSAYDAFVARMNEKAAELGCSHTKFTNPHGLDSDEHASDAHSTANDVMTMVGVAMKNETFASSVKNEQVKISDTRDSSKTELTLDSTDELLGVFDGACGIKTGTTDDAGYCFAGACSRDGDMVYSVVLGSSDDTMRFSDTQTLFTWYYDSIVDYKLCNADDNIMAQVSNKSWLDKTVGATIENPDETVKVNKFDGNISQRITFKDVSGQIDIGQKVGVIEFIQNNEVVCSRDLVAKEAQEAPGVLDNLSIGITRLFNFFTGGQNEASSIVLNDTPLLLKSS